MYYNKYLKYKIKYIKLQELIGGVVEITDFPHNKQRNDIIKHQFKDINDTAIDMYNKLIIDSKTTLQVIINKKIYKFPLYNGIVTYLIAKFNIETKNVTIEKNYICENFFENYLTLPLENENMKCVNKESCACVLKKGSKVHTVELNYIPPCVLCLYKKCPNRIKCKKNYLILPEPVSEPVRIPVRIPVNEPLSEPIIIPVSKPVSIPVSESVSKPTYTQILESIPTLKINPVIKPIYTQILESTPTLKINPVKSEDALLFKKILCTTWLSSHTCKYKLNCDYVCNDEKQTFCDKIIKIVDKLLVDKLLPIEEIAIKMLEQLQDIEGKEIVKIIWNEKGVFNKDLVIPNSYKTTAMRKAYTALMNNTINIMDNMLGIFNLWSIINNKSKLVKNYKLILDSVPQDNIIPVHTNITIGSFMSANIEKDKPTDSTDLKIGKKYKYIHFKFTLKNANIIIADYLETDIDDIVLEFNRRTMKCNIYFTYYLRDKYMLIPGEYNKNCLSKASIPIKSICAGGNCCIRGLHDNNMLSLDKYTNRNKGEMPSLNEFETEQYRINVKNLKLLHNEYIELMKTKYMPKYCELKSELIINKQLEIDLEVLEKRKTEIQSKINILYVKILSYENQKIIDICDKYNYKPLPIIIDKVKTTSEDERKKEEDKREKEEDEREKEEDKREKEEDEREKEKDEREKEASTKEKRKKEESTTKKEESTTKKEESTTKKEASTTKKEASTTKKEASIKEKRKTEKSKNEEERTIKEHKQHDDKIALAKVKKMENIIDTNSGNIIDTHSTISDEGQISLTEIRKSREEEVRQKKLKIEETKILAKIKKNIKIQEELRQMQQNTEDELEEEQFDQFGNTI